VAEGLRGLAGRLPVGIASLSAPSLGRVRRGKWLVMFLVLFLLLLLLLLLFLSIASRHSKTQLLHRKRKRSRTFRSQKMTRRVRC
jgi:hypothetical protein